MKKFLLVMSISLVLTLIFSSLTMATNKIMLSYDMEGKYQSTDSDWWDDNDTITLDTKSGFTIGYEYTHKVRIIEYGFGFETQLKRSLTDFKDAEFKFSPMYGVIYVHFINEGDSLPFFVGRLGFNMHTGNDSYKDDVYGLETELGNGMYGAVGFGVNTERNMAAILYSVNSGTRTSNSDPNYERNIFYSKLSLVYGYKF